MLMFALLSAVGTSATNKTSCDTMPNNDTCTQSACSPSPCSILCGLTSPYDHCEQECAGQYCEALDCKSSIKSCLQKCPGGICKSLQCNAGQCFQSCRGGGCDIMTCPRNATYCEQTSGKEMICDSLNCTQGCPGGKGKMTCSLSVKECRQSCIGGACVVQCDAEKCSLDCSGGICTKIKSATTPKPADIEPSTSKPTPIGTGGHIQLPRLLFVFCLHLSVSALREVL